MLSELSLYRLEYPGVLGRNGGAVLVYRLHEANGFAVIALAQCVNGEHTQAVRRVLVTTDLPLDSIEAKTPEIGARMMRALLKVEDLPDMPQVTDTNLVELVLRTLRQSVQKIPPESLETPLREYLGKIEPIKEGPL